MFSGLIGYRGTVIASETRGEGGVTLVVRCDGAQQERAEIKDSIAINGVCLTATRIEGNNVSFDVVPETLARSTLGTLAVAELVNVEYAMRVGDRVGGHFVYGHVDDVAPVVERAPEGQGERIRIVRPKALAPMIAEKAFIAIDGVSLTVASVGKKWFEIALIPETLARTTLGERPAGSHVNIEIDPIARYVYAAVSR
jgi:riboflavin synthase